MVGIVIVSHSKQLAEGVRELAMTMLQECSNYSDNKAPVKIVAAGGILGPLDIADASGGDETRWISSHISSSAPSDARPDTLSSTSPDMAAKHRELGTNCMQIMQAINEIWSDDGVLILVDLGSAILSAELALDMLPQYVRQTCLISNAPLVEGAVAAAVEASFGHSLDAVNQAAEAARQLVKNFATITLFGRLLPDGGMIWRDIPCIHLRYRMKVRRYSS